MTTRVRIGEQGSYGPEAPGTERLPISPLHRHLGEWLRKSAAGATAEDAALLALSGGLVSHACADGEGCVRLADWAGSLAPFEVPAEWPAEFPADADWRAVLLRVPLLCGTGEDGRVTPLVLRDDRLYLWRWFAAERAIAAAVTRLVAEDRLTIFTGGPGTGKTTRASTELATMLTRNPSLRVELSAPTGKAATRLGESVGAALKKAGISAALEGRTLHRLLGYDGRTDLFRRTAASPLLADVVIVDEASMVDTLMMEALLEALDPTARLILLGDRDQLASVAAGAVLADLCASLVTEPVTERLTYSHRFAKRPGIGRLATAIRDGQVDHALETPADADDASLVPLPEKAQELARRARPTLEQLRAARTPAEALQALAGFRILAATYEGDFGVKALNAAVEKELQEMGHEVKGRSYHLRPVLVTANDYGVGLFNGDVGIIWQEKGRATAVFETSPGEIKVLPPASLPAHETAWAMTIHKSQGSEFDHVLVVLPAEDSRVLGRELLYTGVTRAKQSVTVAASRDILSAAVSRPSRRASGLADEIAALASQPST